MKGVSVQGYFRRALDDIFPKSWTMTMDPHYLPVFSLASRFSQRLISLLPQINHHNNSWHRVAASEIFVTHINTSFTPPKKILMKSGSLLSYIIPFPSRVWREAENFLCMYSPTHTVTSSKKHVSIQVWKIGRSYACSFKV